MIMFVSMVFTMVLAITLVALFAAVVITFMASCLITWHILAFIPAVLHGVNGFDARVVLGAMFTPVLGMARGTCR